MKLKEFSTKFNRHIRVNEEFGESKLLVNGSPQSGRYIRKLWKHAFTAFGVSKRHRFKTILVLGVGGGTVIELLHSFFRNAKITGVDIDKEIITVAKTYFLPKKIQYLQLVQSDAKEYIKHHEKMYDCVIVDIFIGNRIPDFVNTGEFLREIKDLLFQNGVVIINYLREGNYRELSPALYQKLRKLFPTVDDMAIARNRFFFASIV